MFKKNKKESVLDVAITIPIAVFILAVVIFTGWLVMSELKTEFTSDPDFAANGTTQEMMEYGESGISVFDYGILFIIIAMVIGAIAAAFSIKTYPVYSVVFLIIILIGSVITSYLSNTFLEFSSDPMFVDAVGNFTLVYYTLSYLPWIIGICAIIVMIITFAKED